MAYDTATPPKLVMPAPMGQGPGIWSYDSTDAAATVDGAGYITNAKALGMKVGDVVLVTDTDASPRIITSHLVASVNATTGVGDLSDGVTLGSTNSD